MISPAHLLALAAGLSIGLSGLLIRFAHRLPFSKKATADRWHSGCIPDSGGIAIFAALAATYLAGFRGRHTAVALGALAFWILGTIDDRLKLSARTKFAAQTMVVGAVIGSGIVVDITSYPGVNLAITWLWLMGITNAINLIDNMDGLAAGVVVIIALFRSGLLFVNGFNTDALLCAVIAVSVLGFLLFNFKPAKIIMGDGGSMLAGFALAALTIHSPLPHARSLAAGLFYPALTFAYPIFDTTLVSVLRKIAGRPISVGGRDHSSHRLASLGFEDSTVVFTLWGFAAVGSLSGLLFYRLPASTGVAIASLVARRSEFVSMAGFCGGHRCISI
jgi:UDP-GlcNAc:undecaprenyl-phosphate/decaprenyl-phosphate GlcNAc-1-phosphate transferase